MSHLHPKWSLDSKFCVCNIVWIFSGYWKVCLAFCNLVQSRSDSQSNRDLPHWRAELWKRSFVVWNISRLCWNFCSKESQQEFCCNWLSDQQKMENFFSWVVPHEIHQVCCVKKTAIVAHIYRSTESSYQANDTVKGARRKAGWNYSSVLSMAKNSWHLSAPGAWLLRELLCQVVDVEWDRLEGN